jgi:predicted nuclease of predicted toxin-antitoxin system
MNCLLDQCLPRSLALRLREIGWDAVHIGELNCSQASDSDILERAKDEKRVILTLDSDFHQLLALSGDLKPSVVRFRDEGSSIDQFIHLLRQIKTHLPAGLVHGFVTSVYQGRVRLRKLPLSVSSITDD